jgi:hypothetical protein
MRELSTTTAETRANPRGVMKDRHIWRVLITTPTKRDAMASA